MILKDGYDRRKTPTLFKARKWTKVGLLTAIHNSSIYRMNLKFVDLSGCLRNIRLNGQVKTWKTQPYRVEIPIKYGFRECGRWSLDEALDRLRIVKATKQPGADWVGNY